MDKKEALTQIVDGTRVVGDISSREQLAGDGNFTEPVTPSLIVEPLNTGEVQQIVRWANDTRTPLVPVSSGPPRFRGDSVPGVEEAVVVDLHRMNRILRIDRKNRVAMVEPGVTFGELCSELKKQGIRPNLPFLPRSRKSVIASVLEREPVIMPKYHWDIIDPLACVEVVFGSGDLYRTGAAAGPGTIEEQWESGGAQKSNAEPLADWSRLIQGSQGTMGVVTWATIRCELTPEAEEPFLVGSADLPALLDVVHWLVRLRLADECLILNNTNLAAVLAREWPGDYERLRDSLPPWILFFCIGGYEYYPAEKIRYQVEEMKGIAGRAGVTPAGEIGEVTVEEVLALLQHPSAEPYWKTRAKGSCHDIFCLATGDRIPGLIEIVSGTAGEGGYPVPDMGIYLQPVVQGTCYHCEFNLFYDPAGPAEAAAIRNLSQPALRSMMENGAFFSRPYGPWADAAYERDPGTAAALRKLKGILDPNGIMNPGKLCF